MILEFLCGFCPDGRWIAMKKIAKSGCHIGIREECQRICKKVGAGIFGKKLCVNWKGFQAWKDEITTCAEEILEEWRCK